MFFSWNKHQICTEKSKIRKKWICSFDFIIVAWMMIQNATNSSWTHRQTRCSIVGHYLLQLSYNVFVYAHHWSIVECKFSICVKLPNRFVSLYMIWMWGVNRSTTLILISHVFRFCLPIMCSDSDNWIRKHCCAYQSSIFRGSNFKHFK